MADFDTLWAEVQADEERDRVRANLAGPNLVAPDVALAGQRAEAATGVPAAAAESVPLLREAPSLTRDLTDLDVSPRLRAYLAEPRNAAVARDDVRPLRAWESMSALVAPALLSNPMLAPFAAFTGMSAHTLQRTADGRLLSDTNEALRRGQRDIEMRRLFNRSNLQTWRDYDTPNAFSEADRGRLKALEFEASREQPLSFYGQVVSQLPQIPASFDAGFRRGARDVAASLGEVYGDEPRPLNLRSAAEMAVLAPIAGVGAAAAGAGGLVRGMIGFGYEQEAGGAYQEYLGMVDQAGNPLDPAIAGRAARRVGTINAAIELGATGLLGKAAGVDRLFARLTGAGVRDALRRAGYRAAIGRLGSAVLGGGASEGLEELTQESVTIALGLMAQAEQGGEFDQATPDEIADRLFQSFAIGSVVGAGLGGAIASPGFGIDVADIQRMRAQGEMFAALGDAAAASRLRARSPGRYAEAVNALTQGGPLETFRVDGERFAAFFQDQDQDPFEIAERLQGVGREALQHALESGGEVAIPAGTYASQIVGTPADAALRPHVRLGAGRMTPAEVAARMEVGVDLERATGEARRLYTEALAAESEREQVFERIRDMLDVGEFTPSATRDKATVLTANIVTMARRNGESPLALMDRIGLDIRGPFEGQSARAVRDEVLARLDVAGADVPANETPRARIRVAYPRADGGSRVSARPATEDGEIETSWAKLQVRAGRDMVVGEAQNDARPVRRDIFEATYEEVAPGEFQKRTDTPVGYYVLDEDRTIETLEGAVDAKKGDYVLIGAVGEQWPVRPAKFRERYREQFDPYAHFGGVQAIGAPLHTLQTARVMEANGASEQKIWRETGWVRGLDGMWRWEIDDSRADWKHKVLDKFSSKTHLGEVIYYQGDIDAFLSFDELFAAYPVLGSLRLTLHIGPYNTAKFERPGGWIGSDELYVRADTRERALEIVMHELQHAIQWIEAFSPGGSARTVIADATWAQMGSAQTDLSVAFEYFYRFHLSETLAQRAWSPGSIERYPALHRDAMDYARQQAAFDVYQRVLGEAEARAVQLRRGSTFATRRKGAAALTPEERRQTAPSESFDVDPRWAISLPPMQGSLVTLRGDAAREQSRGGVDIYGDRRPAGLGEGYGADPANQGAPSTRRMALEEVGDALAAVARRIEDGAEAPPTHRNALRFGTEQDVADLRAMIARGASAEEILSSPIMRAVEQHSAETPWTATKEQAVDPDFIDGREYVDPRTGETVDAEEAIERLKSIYEAKAGGEVRQGFHAVIVVGHPGAGKSTFINGLARANGAAVLDADIAKEFVPSYDEGYNSQSVHFESAALRSAAQADFLDAGVNVIVERVGDSEIAIRHLLDDLKKTGYTASIVHVAVDGDEAARRMASRFLSGGRYVDPAIFRAVINRPAPAFARIIESADLTGYVEINANGPPGQIQIEKSGGADAPALLAAIGGGARSGALDDGRAPAEGRAAGEAPDAQGSGYAQGEVAVAGARAEGYQGNDTGEAREWLAAIAKGLPMDEASRMARAEAMGFTPSFHGTNRDVQGAFRRSGSGALGPGVYHAKKPETTYVFAGTPRGIDRDGKRVIEFGSGANVMPIMTRGKMATLDQWDSAVERAARELRSDPYFAETQQRAASDLEAQGFAGVSDPERDFHVTFRNHNIRSRFAAFDPDAVASANLLAQAAPRTGPRGYFTPGYGRDGELNSAVINLLEARNLSTLFHEAGHLNLELLFDFARAANAPDGVKADAQTVLEWFGDGLTLETWQVMSIDQRRPYHEMFARGFEAYLLEGKAPSTALRQVFATVKAWLIQIYKSVLALKVDLTPEMRGVMDRLLASEEEIAAAQKLQGADAIMPREAFTGTDKQYARYVANIARAREDAETDLQARIMGAVFADRTRWWRSEERRQRETVEIDIDSQPIRQLYDWLSTGTWRHGPKPDWLTEDVRLSLAAVVRDYGQDAVDALPDDVKKLDVDQLAKIATATRVALNKRGPQRLADWLLHYARKHGGIVDESGGLQQVLDGKRGYGRVINDQGGRHLDDVAMAAWEAGFFGPPPGRVVDGGYAQDAAPAKREFKPSLRHIEKWGDTIDDEASIQKALQRIVQIRNMTPINESWSDLRDAVRDLAELFENSTNRPVDYTSTVAQDRWHFGRQAEALFERYDDADRYIFVEALKLDAEGRQRNRVLVEIAETLREWRNRGVRRKGLRDLFLEDIESDPRDKRRSELGLTQRTGFYSAVARAVKTMPDRQWQMGGEHVINWLLKQPGVKREEIEFLELPALIGRRDLTREEVESYIADRELRLQARFNKFDPENPSTDYDYGGTRAFAGPRIPGRGVYFEDRLAFPKRRPDGRDFAPGMFNSPHWDNHAWGSIRGSIRDVPGYGKTYIAEEIQADFFQGAQRQGGAEPRRPRVAAEDYLSWKARRDEYNAARFRLSRRLDALRTVADYARWGTDLRSAIVEIEIWEKGDTLDDALANLSRLAEAVEASPNGNYRKAALSDLDAIAAEFRAEPEFFEYGANRKFGNPESYYTPDSPFKDTWEDVLLKRLLIRAARENADAVAVSTSETTARIQNTAKAAGFYDEEFRVKLERLAREETGDPSLTIERVNLPTKRGQRAYSVWIVRLPEAARAQIRKRGIRYFQGDSVRNGERPTIREFLDRLNDDIRNDASPVYSSVDAEEVANRLEYEGWKRWFDEHGVDLKADVATLRQQLARAIAKGSEVGLHPDALANLFGIESGEALLRGLAQIEPREQAIKAELRKRMMDEFGDPLNDGTIAEEARLAAHRETRARVIELELEALARATGRASRPVNAAAKEIAERQIERMTVRQIRGYDWFLGNERREARNAVEAIQRGDMHAAEKHKHRQLVNFHLYRLARAAAEEMDVAQRYLKKFARPGVRDNIDGDYLDQIDALLAQFELRKRSGPQMAGAASLSQWAADMERRGLGHLVNVDPRRLADAAKRPFSHLPIDEARGLVDTVKNIEHLGRLKEKLLAAADQRKFRDTVGEVVEAIRATGPVSPATRRTYTPSAFERAQDWVRRAHAEMTRMEFLFRHLDGKANGPVWNALWAPLARAADKESALMRDATKGMQAIWARYSGAETGQMFSKRIDTPRLPVDGPAGRSTSFTKAEIITIALNWGNEGNRTALLNGFRWEEADVKDVLDRVLDARDWQTVQMIWDLIGTFRDEAFALQYDLTGVRPEAVEALPVETPFGTLRGGYYPLKYDGERNLVVARRDEMQTQLEAMGSNWHKPMTRKGHLEARVGSGGRPVKLSLDVFTEHVQNVAHDIAYRRAVIDIDRIIQDEEFAGAFIEAAGRPMYDQLRPWLQSIAADRSDPTAWMWRFLQKLRGNVAIAAMGYRLSTSLQQVTGLLQAVPELGSLEMAGALAKLTRNPAAMFAKAAVIEGKSEFMRSRRQTLDRDIRETIERMEQTDPLYKIRHNAFALVGAFDWAVSATVWTAAYDKAMAGKVNGIDAGDEAATIAYADSMVRTTQSAGLNQDLPAIMRGSQTNKLLTMFFSYFSVLYNWTTNQVLGVRKGRIPPHVFIGNLALIYVVAPFLAEALAGRLAERDGEDEEDRNNRLMWTLIRYPMATIPILRDVSSVLGTTFDYQLSPVQAGPAQITRALQDAAAGRTFDSENTAKTAVNAAGYAFGLPSGQAWVMIDYLVDHLEGEEEGFDPYEAFVTDRR